MLIITLLGALVGACVLGLKTISTQLNKNREKISQQLQAELGFPIRFEKISASFVGFSLAVSLEKMIIVDIGKPTPFIAIDTVKVALDLKSLLLDRTAKFKKIFLQGLKIVIGRDAENKFSLLGLQGESVSSNFEYATLMDALHKHPFIVIKNSTIEWQSRGERINQWLEGELNVSNTPSVEWVLTGKQKIQIREGAFLPPSKFSLSVAPLFKNIQLESLSAQSIAHCGINAQESGWQIDCNIQAKNLRVDNFRQYYRAKPNDMKVFQWLSHALRKGTLNTMEVNIKGPITALQWEGEIGFKGIDCLYTDNWPMIEEANGLVKIENEGITISLLHGKILGAPIETAMAIVKPDEEKQIPTVFFEGSLTSRLEKGLLFVQKSPLQKRFAAPLESLSPMGSMQLQLALKIPLAGNTPLAITGVISTQDGQLKISDSQLRVKNLRGDFYFSENGLKATQVKATVGEKPWAFDIKTIPFMHDQAIQITAQGLLTSEFLQQYSNVALFNTLKGESQFSVMLKQPFKQSASSYQEWGLQSNLQGMAVALPEFLGKKASEHRPTTLKMDINPDADSTIALHMANILDAKMVVEGPLNALAIKQGHVVLGRQTAKWPSKRELRIGGEIQTLNSQAWYEYFQRLKKGISGSLPTIDIHVFAQHLDIYGLSFDKTWLSTQLNRQASSPLSFDGPFIKGTIVSSAREDSLAITLEHLILANRILGKSVAADFMSVARPSIDFQCENLQYQDGNFGSVSFKLKPKSYGYEIQDLNVESKISELSSHGEWHIEQGKSYTKLFGKLISINMGKLLTHWDYPTAIQEASGYLNYEFSWPGHPFECSVNKLEGMAELKFDKGRILGVNPGLGRIMGLLNIGNIKRRLQLDFSDLYKQGFVFDRMKGKFKFQTGIALTEKLLIDGPSAKIELFGNADLKSKDIDLNMKVTPHMEMGLPIVAAIAAGNPAVGAGVWLIDKLTGSKMKKITQHFYHVTGTWDAPSIHELNEKTYK